MRVNCVRAYLTSLCYLELHNSRGLHASVLVSTLYLIVKGVCFFLVCFCSLTISPVHSVGTCRCE